MSETEAPQTQHEVLRLHEGAWSSAEDVLAVEEPLEIRLLWEDEAEGQERRETLAITMRTPGDDFELAAGFLRGEGLIAGREDVLDIAYCLDDLDDPIQQLNVVTVRLRRGLSVDLNRLERHFYTSSSCGVCGKAALEALDLRGCRSVPDGPSVSPALIQSLPERLRDAQAVFRTTGGLHAAGLFDRQGTLLDLREDVGRHNALDKLIGKQLLAGRETLEDCLLLLSGRASYELLQKALTARIPLVAAVGAPSSLAVELAETFNITLCGFVRASGFNVYAGRERVAR